MTVALACGLVLALGAGLIGMPEAGATADHPRPPAPTARVAPSTGDRPTLVVGDPPRRTGPARPAASAAAGSRPPRPARVTREEYRQLLILGGLVGLLISATGLVMVGQRRRMW